MSKSYGNEIALFLSEKELRKKVLSLKTDSTALEDPKVLKGSLLGDLFALFASEEQYRDLEERLSRGGLGWGHAKDELFQRIDEEIRAPRATYHQIREDTESLEKIMLEGSEKARVIGLKVLDRVRDVVGLRPRRAR
jgi:tryptophanyl-tRNA synthetase